MREGGNTVNENTFNWNLNNSRCFSSNFQNPSDRKEVSLYIVLGFIALIMLIPFYMMFVMATHTTSEIILFLLQCGSERI